MMKRLLPALAAMLSCTGFAWAAQNPCPPVTLPVMMSGSLQYMNVPCTPTRITSDAPLTCVNCPDGVTILSPDSMSALCQRVGTGAVTQYVTVSRHLVRGRCVPDAAALLQRKKLPPIAPEALSHVAPVIHAPPLRAPAPPPRAAAPAAMLPKPPVPLSRPVFAPPPAPVHAPAAPSHPSRPR